MTSNKYIVYEFTNGSQYRIPLSEVAQNYANNRVSDPDPVTVQEGLQAEFDKCMNDPNLGIDWFRKEMTWSQVSFEMIQKPKEFNPWDAKQIDIQSLHILDIPE